MPVVIIGTGIIGVSTAFFLSQNQFIPSSEIHLIESSPELFASASGFAGGFLARDWFSPALASLGALSYYLHKQLAEDFQGTQRWGYGKTTTVSLAQAEGRRGDEWLREGASRVTTAPHHKSVISEGPMWLKPELLEDLENISDGDSTAQVNPLRLCQFLLSECKSRGVQLHHPATPISVSTSDGGIPVSVTLRTSSIMTLPCSHLVLAAGAWTPRVYSTLFPGRTPSMPITSLAGHSLVVRSPSWRPFDEKRSGEQGFHAIYTMEENGYSPEIFARADGEIYIAGVNDSSLPLPKFPTDRNVDPISIAKLKATARRLLQMEVGECKIKATIMNDDLKVLREGLCWRPVTQNGAPIIGPAYDRAQLKSMSKFGSNGGIWVAAGHGPWGISLSLGTGKVVSEMVQGMETSADISKLGLV